jgi:adenylosuccinate lyase
MDTYESATPLRETLRKRAAERGLLLDEALLDEACRPERYVERLGGVFERLEQLS